MIIIQIVKIVQFGNLCWIAQQKYKISAAFNKKYHNNHKNMKETNIIKMIKSNKIKIIKFLRMINYYYLKSKIMAKMIR